MCADEPVEPAPGAGSAGARVYHQQVLAQHGRPTRPLPLRHHAPPVQPDPANIDTVVLVSVADPDPHVFPPDPLVRGMDPDPSNIKQK